MNLTLSQIKTNLKKVDFDQLPKPEKNKGYRGQLLELALGIPNSSRLTDLIDGELKSYTKGESIAVTQLRHVLPEVMDQTPFERTKVGIKILRTLYVGFDRDNNFLGSVTHTEENQLIKEDYEYISKVIRSRVEKGLPLSTITGLNGVLQIRTKDSKYKGKYHPIIWNGQQLSNKGYAFYLTGKYAKSII